MNKKIVIGSIINIVSILFLFLLIFLSIYYGDGSEIVLRYRYIRVLSVVLSGVILGITGIYLQGCLRNPLVDHYILGIGGGALFTVYLTIYLYGYNIVLTPIVAGLGGLIALAITIAVAEKIGGSDSAYVLAGLGVNALFSGASILLIYMVSTKYPFAYHLLIGSFVTASPKHHFPLAIALALLLIIYPFLAKPLNTLLLGEHYALQLGYNPVLYRRIAIIVSGIASSIVVSYYGLIGFIGLVSPHIARFLVKTIDHRITTILSGLLSSILLLLTDDLSRIFLIEITGEIPAGAIVSIFGAPFFLFLIIRRFKGYLR